MEDCNNIKHKINSINAHLLHKSSWSLKNKYIHVNNIQPLLFHLATGTRQNDFVA